MSNYSVLFVHFGEGLEPKFNQSFISVKVSSYLLTQMSKISPPIDSYTTSTPFWKRKNKFCIVTLEQNKTHRNY